MSDKMDQQDDTAHFLKNGITHVVVEFLNEQIQHDKACIELVPREWLDRVDGKWICYYPPKKDWSKVDKWTKTSKSRGPLWVGSEVRILKEAVTYEKGIRRLKKFFTDDIAISTSEDVPAEFESQNPVIEILSPTKSRSELQDLPPMFSNEAVSTNDVTSEKFSRADKALSNSFEQRPTEPSDRQRDTEPSDKQRQKKQQNSCYTDATEKTQQPAGVIGDDMLACGIDLERFMTTVISQIQLSEQRILREIDASKRSILYDAQARANEVKHTVMLNSYSSLSTDVSQHMESLGFELPFKTVDDFEVFDAAIATDAEKRKSLECIMTKSTLGNNQFSSALSAILSSLLGMEVQLQYSACGREIRGKKKKNFSETLTFKCMDAVLTGVYAVSTKTITSKVSRWFIGASDRHGGRKQRK